MLFISILIDNLLLCSKYFFQRINVSHSFYFSRLESSSDRSTRKFEADSKYSRLLIWPSSSRERIIYKIQLRIIISPSWKFSVFNRMEEYKGINTRNGGACKRVYTNFRLDDSRLCERFFTRVFDTVRKYFFRDESLPYIPFDRSEKYKRSGLNSRLKAI